MPDEIAPRDVLGETLIELAEKQRPNRVLIGACLPYVYARKIRELGQRLGLDPARLVAGP